MRGDVSSLLGADAFAALRGQVGQQRTDPRAKDESNTGQRDHGTVGDELGKVEGLNVASRAQLLGAYDVNYKGADFLVRVTKVEAGVYVSAVDPRGMPATGEAPTTLIATLKAAMGGK